MSGVSDGLPITVPRITIGAPRSGEGKTTVALGLMAALRRRGLRVQGYKVGPDYLDTGYQRYATGRLGRNLDLFMMGERAVLAALRALDADIAVIEGVMGLFDGHRDGVVPTSTAEVAKLLGAPVIAVIDAAHLDASAAAIALGLRDFDREMPFAGVILNRWNPQRARPAVRDAFARVGIAILGYLPREDSLVLPARHLGLVVADELGEAVRSVMDRLADQIEAYLDVTRILELAGTAPASAGAVPAIRPTAPQQSATARGPFVAPRIAVAQDEAFAFYYADNLDSLRAAGAELVYFSPIHDSELPACDGLYLGGGYPELHAAALSANATFRESLASAVRSGLPTYAECGGLLYLCEAIVDLDGHTWPLVGVVPGRATMHTRLQAMGYRTAQVCEDSLLAPAGAIIHGHEFHYSSCALRGTPRPAYLINGTPEGYAAGNLFASYVHLHFAGYPAAVERWLHRCRSYAEERSPSSTDTGPVS